MNIGSVHWREWFNQIGSEDRGFESLRTGWNPDSEFSWRLCPLFLEKTGSVNGVHSIVFWHFKNLCGMLTNVSVQNMCFSTSNCIFSKINQFQIQSEWEMWPSDSMIDLLTQIVTILAWAWGTILTPIIADWDIVILAMLGVHLVPVSLAPFALHAVKMWRRGDICSWQDGPARLNCCGFSAKSSLYCMNQSKSFPPNGSSRKLQ